MNLVIRSWNYRRLANGAWPWYPRGAQQTSLRWPRKEGGGWYFATGRRGGGRYSVAEYSRFEDKT